MTSQAQGMWTDVEFFFTANSGERASGHVANRVAASFARGEPDAFQFAQYPGDIFDCDPMVLNVLTRGDVAHGARVFLGDIAEFGELLSREAAAGQLDADHVRVGAANAVDAVLQADRLKDLGIELAAPVLVDLRVEVVVFGYIFPTTIGRDWNIRNGHFLLRISARSGSGPNPCLPSR